MYDLIIIGGGPAGMSAALYAARQNLKFIMITKQLGGMANFVPSLKTYLGFNYITGFELIEKFKEHLKQYKVKVKNENADIIKKVGGGFLVKTTKKEYQCRSIIIATGRRFKKLDIPGENKYTGKGLSDCAVCDGPVFKNKKVAVIGGGRTGLFATIFLLEIAKKIYLIEKNKTIKHYGGLKQILNTIKKNKKVKIITNAKPLEIKGNKFAKEIVLLKGNKKELLGIDGIFVEIGYVPNTEFARKLLKTNERGEIIIDEECRTNVKGIFAAGDATCLKEKQVAVSVGEGAKATLSALFYLEKMKNSKK